MTKHGRLITVKSFTYSQWNAPRPITELSISLHLNLGILCSTSVALHYETRGVSYSAPLSDYFLSAGNQCINSISVSRAPFIVFKDIPN